MTPNATSQPKRRDWAALDRQHQRRGTLAFTLLLSPDVLKPPVRKVGRGRPQRYTDTFVEALLMMRVALRLPYRVLEGAARAIFQSHGLDPEQVPDHSLLCKRQSQLAPPKMGAMRWDRKVPAYWQRNRHIDNIHLVGRPAWKKWAKYHRRSAVESATHRWKWVTGERALSRTLTRLKVEGVLRAKFLNSLIASTAG